MTDDKTEIETEPEVQITELDENVTEAEQEITAEPEPVVEEVVTPDYEPTPPPEEPVGWGIDNVYITVEGGERDTIEGWGGHNARVPVILADSEDGKIKFDYDDNGWGPAGVIVYTNGRNPA